MVDLIAVMLIAIFVISVESLLSELMRVLDFSLIHGESLVLSLTCLKGIIWSKPVLMVSAKSTRLASQLGTSSTTDLSIEEGKRPSSDLPLAQVSRLRTVFLLGPS